MVPPLEPTKLPLGALRKSVLELRLVGKGLAEKKKALIILYAPTIDYQGQLT